MIYNYSSVSQIDKDTLDYLNFVSPEPVENMNIKEINSFLTKLENTFKELDRSSHKDYVEVKDTSNKAEDTEKEPCHE